MTWAIGFNQFYMIIVVSNNILLRIYLLQKMSCLTFGRLDVFQSFRKKRQKTSIYILLLAYFTLLFPTCRARCSLRVTEKRIFSIPKLTTQCDCAESRTVLITKSSIYDCVAACVLQKEQARCDQEAISHPTALVSSCCTEACGGYFFNTAKSSNDFYVSCVKSRSSEVSTSPASTYSPTSPQATSTVTLSRSATPVQIIVSSTPSSSLSSSPSTSFVNQPSVSQLPHPTVTETFDKKKSISHNIAVVKAVLRILLSILTKNKVNVFAETIFLEASVQVESSKIPTLQTLQGRFTTVLSSRNTYTSMPINCYAKQCAARVILTSESSLRQEIVVKAIYRLRSRPGFSSVFQVDASKITIESRGDRRYIVIIPFNMMYQAELWLTRKKNRFTFQRILHSGTFNAHQISRGLQKDRKIKLRFEEKTPTTVLNEVFLIFEWCWRAKRTRELASLAMNTKILVMNQTKKWFSNYLGTVPIYDEVHWCSECPHLRTLWNS